MEALKNFSTATARKWFDSGDVGAFEYALVVNDKNPLYVTAPFGRQN
jgi:hypothetical protein